VVVCWVVFVHVCLSVAGSRAENSRSKVLANRPASRVRVVVDPQRAGSQVASRSNSPSPVAEFLVVFVPVCRLAGVKKKTINPRPVRVAEVRPRRVQVAVLHFPVRRVRLAPVGSSPVADCKRRRVRAVCREANPAGVLPVPAAGSPVRILKAANRILARRVRVAFKLVMTILMILSTGAVRRAEGFGPALPVVNRGVARCVRVG